MITKEIHKYILNTDTERLAPENTTPWHRHQVQTLYQDSHSVFNSYQNSHLMCWNSFDQAACLLKPLPRFKFRIFFIIPKSAHNNLISYASFLHSIFTLVGFYITSIDQVWVHNSIRLLNSKHRNVILLRKRPQGIPLKPITNAKPKPKQHVLFRVPEIFILLYCLNYEEIVRDWICISWPKFFSCTTYLQASFLSVSNLFMKSTTTICFSHIFLPSIKRKHLFNVKIMMFIVRIWKCIPIESNVCEEPTEPAL
jgi:hypothetical protein